MYIADLISAARSRNHEERTSYNAEQGESLRFGLFLKDAFESYAVPEDEETGSAYELKAGAEVLSTLPPPVSGETFLKEAVAGGRIVTAEELSLKYLTQCSAFLTEILGVDENTLQEMQKHPDREFQTAWGKVSLNEAREFTRRFEMFLSHPSPVTFQLMRHAFDDLVDSEEELLPMTGRKL